MSNTLVWSVSTWQSTRHHSTTSSPPLLQTNSVHLRHAQPLPSLSTRRRFCIRATTQINSSGSIDSPLMQSMHNKIKEDLNAESVVVKDAYGDGRHVSIDVISAAFEGKSSVNRQRMVYKAIWEELQNTVHAVDQMTTRTPTEAGIKNQ